MRNRLREGLATGKIWLFSIAWLMRHYYRFKKYLMHDFGIMYLKPIMVSCWQRGSRYFRGILADGQKLFIKIDGNYSLIGREIEASRVIMEGSHGVKYITEVRFYNLKGRYHFAAFEWVRGETLEVLLSKKMPQVSFETLGSDLLAILDLLYSVNIIHRDLTPANLLVSLDDRGNVKRLLLIDFAFAIIDDRTDIDHRIPLYELHSLCSGFKPSSLTWDDAYSCLIIVNLIEQLMGQPFNLLRQSFESRVGRRRYIHPSEENSTIS